MQLNIRRAIFVVIAIFCLFPVIDPPIALLTGIVLSQLMGHPFERHNHKAISLLLKLSVIGLGFGMNAFEAAKAGKQGLLFTVASITLTFFAGLAFSKLIAVNKKTAILVTTGTAICGGSAIAAVAPVDRKS